MDKEDKLTSYVKYGLKKGRSKEDIISVLKRYDYSHSEIKSAFKNLEQRPSISKEWLKYGVLGIVLIIGLILVVAGISLLIPGSITAKAIFG